jgi:acetyl-CoA synthetase
VLVEHPAVLEAAVVGKDDPERTQIVSAFCQLAPRPQRITRARLRITGIRQTGKHRYKYPREIHFVEELPKTISGKIRRSELRAELRIER